MNELTINLKPKDKMPLYEQIYRYIKENILNGRIPYQEKLPSTRLLSRHLEVSRSTVSLAYEQLLSEGYIESVPYRGFFVSQIEGLYHLNRRETEMSEDEKKQEESFLYDFSPNGVDLRSFPYNAWRKLSREILTDDKVELFRLGDPQGEEGFRKAVCRYLYQARGVKCSPEQILVGAGSDYLLMLLCMILGREHRIAVENPTYKQAYRLFVSQSYEVVPISMDRCGLEVQKLEQSEANIVYLTPSHQYPTGIVMPVKRRIELLNWADSQEGRYIIEDDYDSEFRYKGKPIPALQGYDSAGKVIYLGTFSKSIAPAIRMSYMVLPAKLLKIYKQNCRFLSSTVSKVDQMIVQHFIEEGYYERHLNKIRALYKSRHDLLISKLKELGSGCSISGEYGGVHLLLTFHDGRSERELIESAAQKGVKVYGLSSYVVGEAEQCEATVLLGYANMTERDICRAGDLLREVWRAGD